MIWTKQGVSGDLQPIVAKALGKVGRLAEEHGEDVYITSKRDYFHSYGSLHPDGWAFDMRPLATVTIGMIKRLLGPDFDVVDEGNHWHIEYDPK